MADEQQPPAPLLCLYVLSVVDGWQTVADIEEQIANTTGYTAARSTLQDSLITLRVTGRVDSRKTVRNGSETWAYRIRNP